MNGGYDCTKEYEQIVVPFWKKFGLKPDKMWYQIFWDRTHEADPGTFRMIYGMAQSFRISAIHSSVDLEKINVCMLYGFQIFAVHVQLP